MPKVKLTPKFVTEVMTTKDKEKYKIRYRMVGTESNAKR